MGIRVGHPRKSVRQGNKQVLPLLFRGEPFPNLADIQYEDVTCEGMSTEALVE